MQPPASQPGFADPDWSAEAFLAGLKEIIPAVQRLQCKQIILLSGKRIEGAAPGKQHTAAIEALKRAADISERGEYRRRD